MKAHFSRAGEDHGAAISNMIDAAQAGTVPRRKGAPPAKGGSTEPRLQIGATSAPLSTAIAGLDQLMARARQLAGLDEKAFAKLKGSEKNAFLAQARGELVTGQPSDVERRDVKPRQLVRSPWNRDKFDPAKMAELRAQVREHGVVVPLIVRPFVPKNDDDRARAFEAHERGELLYEIVAGERRWTAATAEDLASVPVIVRKLTDEEAIELQAIENLGREDLNAMDEARKYQQLCDVYGARGMNKEDAVQRIMARTGKSRAGIFDALRLLQLPEAAAELVQAERLPKSHAALVASIKDPERAAQVAKKIVTAENGKERKDAMPVREVKQLVEAENTRQRNLVWYKDELAKFQKAGHEILTEAESAKVVQMWPHNNEPHLRHDCGFVFAETPCELPGAQWQPYKKLWDKEHKPAPVLAMADNGRPVVVYRREAAIEAAANSATLQNLRAKQREEKAEKKETAEEKRARVAGETFKIALPQMVEEAEAGELSAEAWRWFAKAALPLTWSDAVKACARRRGLGKKENGHHSDQMEKAIDGMTAAQCRGLLVELVLVRHSPGYYDGHNQTQAPHFRAAAAVFGIDLAGIEKEVQTSGQPQKGKGKK